MKKLQSPNSNYFAFFIIIIADVSFLYNLIQYINVMDLIHIYMDLLFL